MTYLGKIIRGLTNHPPRQMLTVWSDPCPKRGVLTTNKKSLVQSLHTLLPKEMTETTITRHKETTGENTTKHTLNKDRKLKLWIKIADDKELWI